MARHPKNYRLNTLRRRSHDYGENGTYFVTICTHRKLALFGHVRQRMMALNRYGCAAWEAWYQTGKRDNIVLDAFIVMPDHIHAIIVIKNRLCRRVPMQRRFSAPISGSLPAIVGAYKSASTRLINEIRDTPGAPVWQRGYYDRVIWDERHLKHTREYIWRNPEKWR